MISTQAEVEAMLRELSVVRQELANLRKRDAKLTGIVKQFMEIDGLDELVDGESGAKAVFQKRTGSPKYDLVSLANAHPDLIVSLARFGALLGDHKVIAALSGKAGEFDAVKRFQMPGEESFALLVGNGDG